MNKIKIIIIILILGVTNININAKCEGEFVNPFTDICWSCFFPFTIGDVKLSAKDNKQANTGKRRDTKNPSNIICSCIRNKWPVGVVIGFWEPFRLIDITNNTGCLVSLGGIDVSFGNKNRKGTSEKEGNTYAHTHLYIYPLTYMLNLFTDVTCGGLKNEEFGLSYMSELDPTYSDNFLPLISFPENILVSNAAATIGCSLNLQLDDN